MISTCVYFPWIVLLYWFIQRNWLDAVATGASAITEEGGVIPEALVDAGLEVIQTADRQSWKLYNTPMSFEGLHDITMTGL